MSTFRQLKKETGIRLVVVQVEWTRFSPGKRRVHYKWAACLRHPRDMIRYRKHSCFGAGYDPYAIGMTRQSAIRNLARLIRYGTLEMVKVKPTLSTKYFHISRQLA
jgi:hypothetical protein